MNLRICYFFLFFLCSASISAQNDVVITPPTKGMDPRDRWILEITYDQWLNTPESYKMPVSQPGVKIYKMWDKPFGGGGVGVAGGVGLSLDNVFSNAAFIQIEDPTSGKERQVLIPFDGSYDYSTSKFGTTYLELPVELRYISKGNHIFRIHAGFRVGYLLQSKWKIIDDAGKRKYYNFPGIEKIRYGVSGRIGYGIFALTGFYSLSPLFEEENGSPVVPFSLGIAIIPF